MMSRKARQSSEWRTMNADGEVSSGLRSASGEAEYVWLMVQKGQSEGAEEGGLEKWSKEDILGAQRRILLKRERVEHARRSGGGKGGTSQS